MLYIPIVVQKQLKYRFYAAAIPGTIYNRDTYLTASSTAVSTHGEQITMLVSYEYDNTKSGEAAIAEWQGMVNNGDNLLWNFDKEIVLKYESNDNLPAGTTFTLVDRNNKNKVYYLDGYDQSGSIALDSFEGYEKSYLCDILGLTAEKPQMVCLWLRPRMTPTQHCALEIPTIALRLTGTPARNSKSP